MAIGVAVAILINGTTGVLHIPELTTDSFRNMHQNPTENLLYPMLFIVISCGALSGFHSTQSPMMARTIKKESYGRYVFYGAMITESVVALIWATAAMSFFDGTEGLNIAILTDGHNPAWIVNEISITWFGKVGAVFAIIGVIAAPITTGDTAFRSARLTVADIFNYKQTSIKHRLMISIPLFAVGFLLSKLEFSTIWKYLGLSNQVLATVVLWAGAMYLAKVKKSHWMMSLPAAFMTTVTFTYLLVAPVKNGGFFINPNTGYLIGLAGGILSMILFILKAKKRGNE
jgi:carbon starvation protein CstA